MTPSLHRYLPAHRPAIRWRVACAIAALSLAACAGPQGASTQRVYDFGPASAAPAVGAFAVTLAGPLALAEIEAPLALDSSAVQYRLAYANAQELRPYALARWSMPPAQLIEQRVRSALSALGPVLKPGEGTAAYTLKLELEEFSQVFDAPGASQGVAQLRATLLKGNALAAQQTFSGKTPAPTADAAGGVQALSMAAHDLAKQLAVWVGEKTR